MKLYIFDNMNVMLGDASKGGSRASSFSMFSHQSGQYEEHLISITESSGFKAFFGFRESIGFPALRPSKFQVP
jgi:hypothetical protein